MKLSKSKSTLYKYLIRYKKWAFLGSLFMLISISLLMPTPLFTMYIIDHILPDKNITLLTIICVLFISVLILNGVSSNFQNYYFSKFNHKVIFDIQIDIIQKIQKTSSQYRQKKQTGYLMSRIRDDTNMLYSLFANTYVSIIKDVITLVVGVVIIFNIHWKLAIISISLLPFFIYNLKRFGYKIKNISSILFELNAQVTKRLQESISLLDTFVVFNAEKYATIRVIEKQKKYIRTAIKKVVIQNIASSIISIIGGFGPVLVLWYGGSEIINNNLSLGELIAFNSFLGYIFGPTSRVVNSFLNMQQAWAAWDRVYDLLTNVPTKKHLHDKTDKKLLIKGNIEFKNICLKYDNTEILKSINLKIQNNETVAIVGESGCGKSSLVNLLVSLNNSNSGSIKVDGVELNKCTNIKQYIALVQQEPVLFSDTIKNNIKLGKFNATDTEVIKAARKANIHKFIEQLPEKYDTSIDERGLNMSVGQKQRIAIARCIIRNPSIFIMDEPTSSLDTKSEKELMDLLSDFIKTRTTIIIAHRLTSITFADRIIVMDKGRIVECGTHDELIDKKSFYAKLWDTQNLNNEYNKNN